MDTIQVTRSLRAWTSSIRNDNPTSLSHTLYLLNQSYTSKWGFPGGAHRTRFSYARGAESFKWKSATDMAACQMRSTMEFGVAREGDKEETSTADGIEDTGPGLNGWDLVIGEANQGTLDLECLMGTSPCELRVPRECGTSNFFELDLVLWTVHDMWHGQLLPCWVIHYFLSFFFFKDCLPLINLLHHE
jgi:hypothetical protein